jgi:hypothetical protein
MNKIEQKSPLAASNDWERYYLTKPVNPERISEIAKRHHILLDKILSYQPKTVIEIGIGTGLLGHSLKTLAIPHNQNIQITELDYSEKLLHESQKFHRGNQMRNIAANTFNLPFTHSQTRANQTIIFHQGLLEHFNDNQINQMINEQLKIARIIIASVPSEQYCFTKGLRGDERLMNGEQWKTILNQFEVETEYYGDNPGEQYHICLTIKNPL